MKTTTMTIAGLFATKAVQQEVMDAYESAFKTTHILLRYPVGNQHDRLARNSDRPFGYHDDSFAWTTLDSGKSSDGWFLNCCCHSGRASFRIDLGPGCRPVT